MTGGVYGAYLRISNADDVTVTHESSGARQPAIAWCDVVRVSQSGCGQASADVVVVHMRIEDMAHGPAAFSDKAQQRIDIPWWVYECGVGPCYSNVGAVTEPGHFEWDHSYRAQSNLIA